MPTQIALSENAIAVLRFEIKGWQAKNQESRLPAYRELAAAGIMEPVPDSELEYRFTEDGLRQREELLAEAQDRIERERYEPPDASNLSVRASALLRGIVSGERVEITTGNRPAFRELAAARIVILGHSFAKGDESVYKFTYWGYKLRFELVGKLERNRKPDGIMGWLRKWAAGTLRGREKGSGTEST